MSTPINDGDSAFPYTSPSKCSWNQGMSLRDYFAGQALAGMLGDNTCNPPIEEMGAYCYEVADSMLAAREAQK